MELRGTDLVDLEDGFEVPGPGVFSGQFARKRDNIRKPGKRVYFSARNNSPADGNGPRNRPLGFLCLFSGTTPRRLSRLPIAVIPHLYLSSFVCWEVGLGGLCWPTTPVWVWWSVRKPTFSQPLQGAPASWTSHNALHRQEYDPRFLHPQEVMSSRAFRCAFFT